MEGDDSEDLRALSNSDALELLCIPTTITDLGNQNWSLATIMAAVKELVAQTIFDSERQRLLIDGCDFFSFSYVPEISTITGIPLVFITCPDHCLKNIGQRFCAPLIQADLHNGNDGAEDSDHDIDGVVQDVCAQIDLRGGSTILNLIHGQKRFATAEHIVRGACDKQCTACYSYLFNQVNIHALLKANSHTGLAVWMQVLGNFHAAFDKTGLSARDRQLNMFVFAFSVGN